MSLDHHEIILIDTPGFGDTDRGDFDILVELSIWLQSNNMKLSGLIYLQCITHTEDDGSARWNLEMTQKLVGVASLSDVLLVTNRWEDLEVCTLNPLCIRDHYY